MASERCGSCLECIEAAEFAADHPCQIPSPNEPHSHTISRADEDLDAWFAHIATCKGC